MTKSIETIWKEGFLNSDALVAPIVNDLYHKKSQHIVEKFKRMFRINLSAVLVGAILGVIGFALLKLPLVGIGLALVLAVIFVVNKRLLTELEKIDKSVSSYVYLKAFDSWLRDQISINARMAKLYYPAIFLSLAFGFWFSPHGPRIPGILAGGVEFGYQLNGIPVLMLVPVLLLTFVLWIFGDRIYQWDLNVIYGRVLKKLDEILTDMEELRS
jgi:hypothetical protein